MEITSLSASTAPASHRMRFTVAIKSRFRKGLRRKPAISRSGKLSRQSASFKQLTSNKGSHRVAVAFGRRGSNPARLESFIVTEELAPTVSLEDYCRDWPTQPPAPALKRALIARVAEMAGKMHRGGVNHRDCYICHFLLHTEPTPTPERLRLSLIDLHRAQVRAGAAPRRWRDKDLAALHFSTLEIGLTARDRLRFLRAYFDRPLRDILIEEADLLAHLAREGARLTERYRRKFAPQGAS